MPPAPTTPASLRSAHFWRELDRDRHRPITGDMTTSTPLGHHVRSRPVRSPLTLATTARYPFQVSITLIDTTWKARIYPGTLDGATPVVGDIEGTGGTPLTDTPAPLLTLVTGENVVVLAVKVDLETHTILRSTIETREDSDLDDIIDTDERTRIFFDIIAELNEAEDDTWSLLTQTRRNNLTYDYGRLYCANT